MSSAKQYNLPPYKVIDEADVGADVESAVTDIFNKDNVGFQAIWDGTLAGTFDVQISLDYDKRNPSAATWTSITLDPVPTAAGSPDNAYIDITQISSAFIRLVFNYDSGSGNLTAWIVGKGV